MCRIERIVVVAAAFVLLLGGTAVAGQEPPARAAEEVIGVGDCEYCHVKQPDARLSSPTLLMKLDVHGRAGLGCADCHGGDPVAGGKERAHAAEAGFVGRLDVQDIPELCARCHSDAAFMVKYNPGVAVDQLEKYKTSRHGELLAMGLRKVATCSSCHTSHNVRAAQDPMSNTYPANLPRTCATCHGDAAYMAGFPIPTDQFEKFAASVHGVALLEKEDLASPACNDCHSNHGAVPPGAQSLAHVCGNCHALNMELFEKSPHLKPFDLQELPQCTVCHDHHAIAPPTARTFNMEADSVCITCHRTNDAGWQAGKKMYGAYTELVALQNKAGGLLDDAQKLGMDIAEGRFTMRDFRSSLFQLRTLSHQLDLVAYFEKAKEARGQADGAIRIAEGAIGEFHFRRQGLTVSVLLFLPVLLLLYLKIRSLGRETGPERHETVGSGVKR